VAVGTCRYGRISHSYWISQHRFRPDGVREPHVNVIPSSSPATRATAAAIRCRPGAGMPTRSRTRGPLWDPIRQSLDIDDTARGSGPVERGGHHRHRPAGFVTFVDPDTQRPLAAVTLGHRCDDLHRIGTSVHATHPASGTRHRSRFEPYPTRSCGSTGRRARAGHEPRCRPGSIRRVPRSRRTEPAGLSKLTVRPQPGTWPPAIPAPPPQWCRAWPRSRSTRSRPHGTRPELPVRPDLRGHRPGRPRVVATEKVIVGSAAHLTAGCTTASTFVTSVRTCWSGAPSCRVGR
jgi:hypothetical protein